MRRWRRVRTNVDGRTDCRSASRQLLHRRYRTPPQNDVRPSEVEGRHQKPLCVKGQFLEGLGRVGWARCRCGLGGWLSLLSGPGTDLSEVPVSGFNPVALDYRVAPACRPGPTFSAGCGRRFGVAARPRRRSAASTRATLLCGSCPRLGDEGSRRVPVCRDRLG